MSGASAVAPRSADEPRSVPGASPAPSGEGVPARESPPDLSRSDLSRSDLSRSDLSRSDLSRSGLSRSGRAVADAIRAAAAPAAVPFVGVFDRVGSTNDLLRAVAADGTSEILAGPSAAAGGPPALPPIAAVAFAFEQTAGRGRFGRRWASPPGGFYLSLLVAAPPAAGLPLLPIAAGLAAAEAVEQAAGLRVELRWPNDLDWNGGKLAGVLAETGFSPGPGPGRLLRKSPPPAAPPGASPERAAERTLEPVPEPSPEPSPEPAPELAVVGFGVNLAPVELDPGAGDRPPLRPPAHLPKAADPARLAGALTASFRRAFGLAAADPAALAARWEERSPTARGVRCRVRLRGGGSAEGWTDGLARDGGIRVRLAAGGAAVIHASDAISFAHAPASR